MTLQSTYNTTRRWVEPWLSNPTVQMGLLPLLALGARLAQIAASPDYALFTSDAESYHRIAILRKEGLPQTATHHPSV